MRTVSSRGTHCSFPILPKPHPPKCSLQPPASVHEFTPTAHRERQSISIADSVLTDREGRAFCCFCMGDSRAKDNFAASNNIKIIPQSFNICFLLLTHFHQRDGRWFGWCQVDFFQIIWIVFQIQRNQLKPIVTNPQNVLSSSQWSIKVFVLRVANFEFFVEVLS